MILFSPPIHLRLHHRLSLFPSSIGSCNMKLSIFSVSAIAVSANASAHLESRQSNWTVGQTVQTSSGPVNGHPSRNDSQVSEYLGIPFAKPPVGDLRFAAPVAYNGNATINGTNFVSKTFQRHLSIANTTIGLYMSYPNYHIQWDHRRTIRYHFNRAGSTNLTSKLDSTERGLLDLERVDEATNRRFKEGCFGVDLRRSV